MMVLPMPAVHAMQIVQGQVLAPLAAMLKPVLSLKLVMTVTLMPAVHVMPTAPQLVQVPRAVMVKLVQS